ncbi:MAG: hypothetical protein DMG28_04765 [Acidobacteria bacterium]|nr:MAG: hypothetical protein DMG28_04765 [Acidobacteriota bacterium]
MKASKIRRRGFSMVEVVIVLTVVLILAGVAIPNIATAIANVRLRGAASDLSGLMQSARLVAVKNNATYTVLFNPTSTLLGAYLDLNNNGSFDTGEPMIQFGGSVSKVAAPNGSGNSPSALDGNSGALGWTATTGNLSFNRQSAIGRGLGSSFHHGGGENQSVDVVRKRLDKLVW